jgi:uncharacterized surface protein with fasciclin (FAS1) repeats
MPQGFAKLHGERFAVERFSATDEALKRPIRFRRPIPPGRSAMNEHSQSSWGEPATEVAERDIIDTALAVGNFKTLTEALERAKLLEALKGQGPFTLFAPPDSAFTALHRGLLNSLMEDVDQLRSVLLYHVLPGRLVSADVMRMRSAKTLNGQDVHILTSGASCLIDEAHIINADVPCANGVIHVIDKVLMPPRIKPCRP